VKGTTMVFDHGVANTSGSTGVGDDGAAGHGDLGDAGALDVAAHGHRLSGPRRADDGDDAVLLDELARRGDRLGFVGGVVLDDHLDGPAVDAARLVDPLDLELDRVLLGLAETGVRARQRDDAPILIGSSVAPVSLGFAPPQPTSMIASAAASAATSIPIESLNIRPRIVRSSVLSVCALRPGSGARDLSAYDERDRPAPCGRSGRSMSVMVATRGARDAGARAVRRRAREVARRL
jgi:hypothetical protein